MIPALSIMMDTYCNKWAKDYKHKGNEIEIEGVDETFELFLQYIHLGKV